MTRAARIAITVAALAGATGRGAPAPDIVDESMAYAAQLADKDWYDLAVIVYADIVERAPHHAKAPDARFLMGRLDFKRQAYDASARDFVAFLIRCPDDPRRIEALYWAAESYYADEHYADALKYFQMAMRECTDDRDELYVHSCYGAGWCHFKLQQYEQAVERFKAFTEKFFYYKLAAKAQIALGRAYAKLKRYDEACQTFSRVAQDATDAADRAEACLALGRTRFDTGRYVVAMAAFDDLLAKYPDSELATSAMWWKARVFQEWGQADRADQVFGELARLYPDSRYGREAILKLGEHLRQLAPDKLADQTLSEDRLYALAEATYADGKIEPAAKRYEQLLHAYPKGQRAADAHFQLGLCLLKLKQYAEAKAHFLKVTTDFPAHETAPRALYQAARCAYQTGHYDQAQQLAARALERPLSQEARANARFLLGECLFHGQAYAQAAENYTKALELGLGQALEADAGFRLGSALYHAGQFAPAAQTLAAFGARFPNSPNRARALYLEADSLLRAQKFDDAAKRFAAYGEQFPKGESAPQSLYQLGYLAERAGRAPQALAYYRQATTAAAAANLDAVASQAAERRAWLLYRQSDQPAALDAFLDLVRRWPDRKLGAQTYNWLGLGLFKAKRFKDAKVAFGRLLAHWGEDKTQSPLVEQACYYLAQCERALGRADAAHDMLVSLVVRFPKSRFVPAAKLAIADRYRAQGQLDQAEPIYSELAHASAGALQAEALCKLGGVLRQQGRYDRALKALMRVAVLFDARPTRVWALRAKLGAGQCRESLGQPQAAARLYRAVAECHGDAPEIIKLKQDAAARLLAVEDRAPGQAEGKRQR